MIILDPLFTDSHDRLSVTSNMIIYIYIYIESYGGISIVGGVLPALYTHARLLWIREREREGRVRYLC